MDVIFCNPVYVAKYFSEFLFIASYIHANWCVQTSIMQYFVGILTLLIHDVHIKKSASSHENFAQSSGLSCTPYSSCLNNCSLVNMYLSILSVLAFSKRDQVLYSILVSWPVLCNRTVLIMSCTVFCRKVYSVFCVLWESHLMCKYAIKKN